MNLRLAAFLALLMGLCIPIVGAKIAFYYDYHQNDAYNMLQIYAGKPSIALIKNKTLNGGQVIIFDTKNYNKVQFKIAGGPSSSIIDLTKYPDGKTITLQYIDHGCDMNDRCSDELKVVE